MSVPGPLGEPSPEGAEPASAAPRPFHFEEALAALIMALLCLITFGNVLARYFTNISFAFTEEFSVFLVVVMTFIGAATAFTRGHHLALGFLVERLPPRGRSAQRVFAILCALAMFGILAWWGGLMWWDDYGSGLTSPGLGLPQWWYTAAVPLLSLLIVWRLLQLLFARRR
ncbi:TRAP transporter small permease [Variovorax saccharolyticus]|uniref:TRAP transporter small permease n=1 Tax=Variovorax saccharolyticus TaxID=3053516 RepID=UPI0025754586|nr:TRAP transporter small permease [Variovorax sp. J22R187]MDM0021208.1 TRAP transporter small permease [Variovorax sp. J22R187]